MTAINKLNNYTDKVLNERELKLISGGAIATSVIIGGVLVYIGKQAFEHAYQIAKGYKKGYK